jgi:ribosomal protein S27AE
MTDEKPRRGRPPGSKNKPHEFAVENPAACPRCGSTDLECLKLLGEQNYSGRTVEGFIYDRIQRRRKRCKMCGQCVFVSRYVRHGKPPEIKKQKMD